MAKRKTAPARKRTANAGKKPAQVQLPFLSADDLRGRTTFRILPSISVFNRQNGSAALFIGVENRAREGFTWSLNTSSPDRITLQQRFGRNVLDWPGKTVDLMPVEGSRGGRFVNIYDPLRESTTSRRTPRTDDDIPF